MELNLFCNPNGSGVLSSVHASDGRGQGAIERADQCRHRYAQPVVQQYPRSKVALVKDVTRMIRRHFSVAS
jgi:hypothetical protein